MFRRLRLSPENGDDEEDMVLRERTVHAATDTPALPPLVVDEEDREEPPVQLAPVSASVTAPVSAPVSTRLVIDAGDREEEDTGAIGLRGLLGVAPAATAPTDSPTETLHRLGPAVVLGHDDLVTERNRVRMADKQVTASSVSGAALQFGGRDAREGQAAVPPVASIEMRHRTDMPTCVDGSEYTDMAQSLLMTLNGTGEHSILQVPSGRVSIIIGDVSTAPDTTWALGVDPSRGFQILKYNKPTGSGDPVAGKWSILFSAETIAEELNLSNNT